MTIKAIETCYKGYRFRSRLEARWAVAFDAAGIPWEYEQEGFDVHGRWYLPDFVITTPEGKCVVEIKPEISEKIPRLYMAGKMPAEDWRNEWRPSCLRDRYLGDLDEKVELTIVGDEARVFIYDGPYGYDRGGHSLRHGVQGTWGCLENEIVIQSFSGIK